MTFRGACDLQGAPPLMARGKLLALMQRRDIGHPPNPKNRNNMNFYTCLLGPNMLLSDWASKETNHCGHYWYHARHLPALLCPMYAHGSME